MRNSNKLFFVHIEKAAGSTIHDILYRNFFPYYVTSPVPFMELKEDPDRHLTCEQVRKIDKYTPGLKAVGGHSLRLYDGLSNNFSGSLFFTFIRDPLDRYLSHYYYQNEVMGIERSFEEYLGDGYFDNFMCKKICGYPNADMAISLLEEMRVIVGIVEKFDASLTILKSRIEDMRLCQNFDITYSAKNTRGDRKDSQSQGYGREFIIEKYKDRVVEKNSEDLRLYHHFQCGVADSDENFNLADSNPSKVDEMRASAGKLFRKTYFRALEKAVGFL